MMKKVHKNLFKFKFYIRSLWGTVKPRVWVFRTEKVFLDKLEGYKECPGVRSRVEYYNKVDNEFYVSNEAVEEKKFLRKGHISSYFFDLKVLLKEFPKTVKFDYIFGDVTFIPASPSFVKSRPISNGNKNSVLLKLDSVRHYYFYPDRIKYKDKIDLLVWRGAAHQPHRKFFIKKFYNHLLCDVGCVHRKSEGKPWHKDYMSISEQLEYKFILSIEGNDVATNLKWIMASNSLCFMVKPKFETWFMEGLLIPGYHYVELKSDYSDIEEKIDYYLKNPDKAEEIINNANEYVSQFMDHEKEKLISLLVMKKYFELSAQIKKY